MSTKVFTLTKKVAGNTHRVSFEQSVAIDNVMIVKIFDPRFPAKLVDSEMMSKAGARAIWTEKISQGFVANELEIGFSDFTNRGFDRSENTFIIEASQLQLFVPPTSFKLLVDNNVMVFHLLEIGWDSTLEDILLWKYATSDQSMKATIFND